MKRVIWTFAGWDQLLPESKLTKLLVERCKSLASLSRDNSKMTHGFMLWEEKQQSGQAEMRGRAQARSLLISPEAGLSLHF